MLVVEKLGQTQFNFIQEPSAHDSRRIRGMLLCLWIRKKRTGASASSAVDGRSLPLEDCEWRARMPTRKPHASHTKRKSNKKKARATSAKTQSNAQTHTRDTREHNAMPILITNVHTCARENVLVFWRSCVWHMSHSANNRLGGRAYLMLPL